jgi:hypothetical protein
VPLTLLRESFEMHVGAAAAALGAGKGFFIGGDDAKGLVDLGTRLMAFDWPAIPNFSKVGDRGWGQVGGCDGVARGVASWRAVGPRPCLPLPVDNSCARLTPLRPHTFPPQLHAAVTATVASIPSDVVRDAKAVAPTCLRKCCKPDTQVDASFKLPSLACPTGRKLDVVGSICVGELAAGYAACPAGTQSCFLSSWHRPLCATKSKVFGVDACAMFEVLAFAHKLPKVACP